MNFINKMDYLNASIERIISISKVSTSRPFPFDEELCKRVIGDLEVAHKENDEAQDELDKHFQI